MPPRTLAIARAHMRVLLRRLIHFSPEHLKRRAFVLLRRPVTARRPTCPSRPCPCTITIDHRRKAGMMTRATVTSRVVAEIYRGVEFPAGWVDKPDVLNVGMARDTVASVAAMFDAELKPIALCWRIGGGEETFACASSGATDGTSLVDGLNSALAQESLRLGTEDLLGTMLWAPDELRPDQGQAVHRIEFLRGNAGACQFPLTGWNIPPRTLVARDRKSTRLNSSHPSISYAVFCLKKKNIHYTLFSAYPIGLGQLCQPQTDVASVFITEVVVFSVAAICSEPSLHASGVTNLLFVAG